MLAGTQKPMLGTKLDRAHPLAKGLVGSWLFNEGVGNIAYDTSGYADHGTLTNMAFPPTVASGWNSGRRGPAIAFDGTDDYVDCGPLWGDQNINEWSAELWLKWDVDEDGGILTKPGEWLPGSDFSFLYSKTNERLHFGYNGIAGYGGWSKNFYPNVGQWHHFTITFEITSGDNSEINIYQDGTPWWTEDSTCGPMNGATKHLIIGRGDQCGGTFNGAIDEVKIYNRALNAEEIKWLYREPYAMFERGELLL